MVCIDSLPLPCFCLYSTSGKDAVHEFFEFQGVGKPLGAFTLENYSKFITNAFYWKVLGMTVLLSFISTLLCVAVGYPVAYCIARAEAKKKAS